MSAKCVTCGEPISQADTGRPRRYCSTACKRAAEYERQRLDRHAGHVRREFVKAKVAAAGSHAAPVRKAQVKVLTDELAAAEARLLELLQADDGPAGEGMA